MAFAEIKIEFTPEAAALVEKLTAAVDKLTAFNFTAPAPTTEVVEKPVEAAPAVKAEEPAPAPTTTKVEEAPEPVTEFVKTYTLDQIRTKVSSMIMDNDSMRAKVKKTLNKYADKIVHLKEEDYPAFMADLEALENG